jgi:hypothetical protein
VNAYITIRYTEILWSQNWSESLGYAIMQIAKFVGAEPSSMKAEISTSEWAVFDAAAVEEDREYRQMMGYKYVLP